MPRRQAKESVGQTVESANGPNRIEILKELAYNGHELAEAEHRAVISHALRPGLTVSDYNEIVHYSENHLAPEVVPQLLLDVAEVALTDTSVSYTYDKEEKPRVRQYAFDLVDSVARSSHASVEDLKSTFYKLVNQGNDCWIPKENVVEAAVRVVDRLDDSGELPLDIPYMKTQVALLISEFDRDKGMQLVKKELALQALESVKVEDFRATDVCLTALDILPSDYEAKALSKALETAAGASREKSRTVVSRGRFRRPTIELSQSNFEYRRDLLWQEIKNGARCSGYLSRHPEIVRSSVGLFEEKSNTAWMELASDIENQYIYFDSRISSSYTHRKKLPELQKAVERFAAVAPEAIGEKFRAQIRNSLRNAQIRS